MNIIDFIGVGRENAVSRQRLVELTGEGDRAVRKAIEAERIKTPIINLKTGGDISYRQRTIYRKWRGLSGRSPRGLFQPFGR